MSFEDARSLCSVFADNGGVQAFDRRQLLTIPALLSAALFFQRPAWGATTGTCCYALICGREHHCLQLVDVDIKVVEGTELWSELPSHSLPGQTCQPLHGIKQEAF